MLQNILEQAIDRHVYRTGTQPVLIIVHPATWQQLREQVFSELANWSIDRHSTSLKYRGIRVIRSVDVQEGIFEVT